MSIRVLLADDSDIMLSAMRQILAEEPCIEIVGEAANFAATMQLIAALKPEVLLLDLHMAETHDFTPHFVKEQLLGVAHTLAVSFSNDAEAQALAETYGASSLLDKMNLFSEMIPAIMRFCTDRSLSASAIQPRQTALKSRSHAA
jgi:DNA-binding NarL/FixJ family response regulator